MSIHVPWAIPPTTVEVILPQRSAIKVAGTVTKNIRSAETPEAKKEAVLLVRPAA